MNITQNNKLVERVKDLAVKKATGTPKQLADKLNVSERSIYRIIQYLRDCGTKLNYCRARQTYVLEE